MKTSANALPLITAEAPEGVITGTFDASFAIVEPIAASAPPATDPNPSANLDNPDSEGGKKTPTTGPNDAKNGTQKPDKNGTPPVPRFNMSAYNGGPMNLNGYRFPVIVDGSTVRAAAANIPVFVFHAQTYNSPADQMQQLMGQTDSFSVDQATGKISASGLVTGESEMVKAAMAHAKNGFKFQASINGRPGGIVFIPEGTTTTVNGRSVTGPINIAKGAVIDHIALVPLGADTTTASSIAASAAKGIVMEFAAWLMATYELDAAKLTASQKTKFEAEFAKISASHAGGGTAVATTTAQTTQTATPPAVTANNTITIDTNAAITAHRAAIAAEDKRIADVQRTAKGFPEISAKAVAEGWDVTKTELEVLRASRTSEAGTPNIITAGGNPIPKDGLGLQAVPADRGGRHVSASGRVSNELCAAIEVAGLISAGYNADRLVKNPAYGQRSVEVADTLMRRFGRGLGPMGLMRLTAANAGIHLSHNNDEALGTLIAEFSTLGLPTILSNVMNKFLLDSYLAVDPDFCAPAGSNQIAWQQFTKRGPLQDFKPHYRVRLTGDLEFKDLGQAGEIQSGKIGEQSYSLQATTKAIMFGLTRADIINDDLAAMSTIPTLFGRGAGIRVAKFIYALLIAALQSDRSTAFFTATAITTVGNLMQPNLIATNALSFAALEAAEAAFMAQTDPHGQPAGCMPTLMLVPPGVKNLAMQLWQSMDLIPSLASGGNARGVPQKNTYAGRFRPVCSNWLASLTAAQASAALGFTTANAGSNSTWYLMSDSQQPAYPIEAGFLNGQEMPIVERDEMQFDRLGIAFRGFQDFGGNLAEPRSVVKNTA